MFGITIDNYTRCIFQTSSITIITNPQITTHSALFAKFPSYIGPNTHASRQQKGTIGASLGMPDIHSGYGFAIGNIAAMDMSDPDAVVSPGGVGFDINCGVRLLRTNLTEEDIDSCQKKLADALYSAIPVGVGADSLCRLNKSELDEVLKDGMKWAERKGHCWKEDRQHVEEGGCFATADPGCVSARAKQRGQSQVGSLGSGNHYVEVQVVDEVYNQEAADCMGIGKKGQICVMIHSGSRGLGHQVCTDALQACDAVMKRMKISVADRQLACAPISSPEGTTYLGAMAAAANFAFCNRTLLAEEVRSAFSEVFSKDARALDMHVVYDVAHNIAKFEEHEVGGAQKRLLVHRKGATRAFAPGHKEIPQKYREIGQPVLIGGSMGTCSYVLTGTKKAMEMTFGSTCHGAGRAMSRSKAMRELDSKRVLSKLASGGIVVRIQTKRLAAEEAPESYKDVCEVVETCHLTGISNKCVKLKPIISIKG